MYKRVSILATLLLVIAVGTLVALYSLGVQDLKSARAEVTVLKADFAESENEIDNIRGGLVSAQADLDIAQARNETLQASLEAQQDVNSALSEELKRIKYPRHFNSVQELGDWLHQDNTDYAFPRETSDNRAYILQVRALWDGYLLPAFSIDCDGDWYTDWGGNQARIGDELYYVWAGDDECRPDQYVITVPTYPIRTK